MDPQTYVEKARAYLHRLCEVKPNRRTGSLGNIEAVSYFADRMKQLGYEAQKLSFPVMDYRMEHVQLSLDQTVFEVYASPYSLGCNIKADLVVATSFRELEEIACRGKLLLLAGDICAEQLSPKEFVFYNPESHKHIYALLEEKQPLAIITATSKNPEAVGALDPFPLFCDGDFDIPSVYCREEVGRELTRLVGETLNLSLLAERIPSTASNVRVIVKGESEEKIVVAAHIDAYEDSPGALDNASGSVVLLLLAEMLRGKDLPLDVELLAINGEDHYSAAGEMDYLKRYGNEIRHVRYVINIDAVGYNKSRMAYSFYECDEERKEMLRAILGRYPNLVEGSQWYSGDHMVFVQKGNQAVAITSEYMEELMTSVIHTKKDTMDLVDVSKLVELAEALHDIIMESIL